MTQNLKIAKKIPGNLKSALWKFKNNLIFSSKFDISGSILIKIIFDSI